MACATLRTSLTALAQFQSFIHIATFATGLRTWGEAIYLYEVHTVPTTLIFKQGERSEHMEYVECHTFHLLQSLIPHGPYLHYNPTN